MIISFFFALHLLFAAFVYLKKAKNDSLKSAFYHLILIIILFAVGWSLINLFAAWIIDTKGFGKELDRNTIVLIVLTIGEAAFYKGFYKNLFTADGKEK